MSDLICRPAHDQDLGAITAIFNDAVLHTTGSLDSATKSEAEMAQRFGLDRARYPALVVERSGQVIAWAHLTAYSDRCAYGDIAENSIYVAPEAKGQGVGAMIMAALIEAGRPSRFHSIIARIAEGNPASLALHRRAGFQDAGFLAGIGQKHGRRYGVHVLQFIYER